MPRPSAAGTLIVLLITGAVAAQAGGKKKAEATKEAGLSPLEKELRQAMSTGQADRANEAIDQLAATGDPDALTFIIQNALTGVSYDVEKHAGAVLLAAEEPGLRARVLEGAQFQKNTKWKSRVILVAVVAQMKNEPAALGVLHNALKDPSKPVALSALYWLRELKQPASMEPLIATLEAREKRPGDRLYHDIVKTLQVIGGVDLEQSADWKSYWSARKLGTAPVKRKDSVTIVVKKQSFFAVNLDTDRVLFVIDTSGSMTKRDPELEEVAAAPPKRPEKPAEPQGTTVVVKKTEKKPEKPRPPPTPPASRERMARVKAELTRVVNGLPTGTRFGILAFSHELKWWGAAKSLKEASAGNKADAVNWVRDLVADGATRTDLALEEALNLSEIDTIYLLTDGAPQDENNNRLEIEPIVARTKEANRFLKCRINTISFAQIKDRRMVTFVKEIAAQNDGVCAMLP